MMSNQLLPFEIIIHTCFLTVVLYGGTETLCHGHFFAITARLPRALSTFLLNNSALCGLRIYGEWKFYTHCSFLPRGWFIFSEFLQLEIVFAVPPSHSFQLMAAPGSHEHRLFSIFEATFMAPFFGWISSSRKLQALWSLRPLCLLLPFI